MRACSSAGVLVTLLAAGCGSDGPEVHTVNGSVLFQGEPATGAMVIFNPKSGEIGSLKRPSAKVGKDGKFELSTFGAKDGALAGEYLVTVSWREFEGSLEGDMGLAASADAKAGGGDRLGGRYSQPNTSGLTATVVAGTNELPPFELE